MNKKGRGRLHDALKLLSNASSIAESVCDDEQDSIDNYPENLQCTEKFERMESAVDGLNDALEKIDEAKEYILSAI